MKFFFAGTWRYTWQMIALFVIASVAIHSTVSYLEDQIPIATHPAFFKSSILAFWAMVIGFMFLMGGLALWTIRFATETESLKRVGTVVDSLHPLKDGLISIERKGRILGSNPAANALAANPLSKGAPLNEGFPCLSMDDITLLLDPAEPNEIERTQINGSTAQTLRFRSQPSEGLSLILISDVTHMQAREHRRQQLARWQLIGRIARGVAHDFNNLLCVIAGHASLVARARPGSIEMENSLRAIRHESDRGGSLAANLLNLSTWAVAGQPTNRFSEHVKRAASLLEPSLPLGWKVEATIGESFPTIALSGIQIEQVILNLGLLSADTLGKPGILRITARKPAADHLLDVGNDMAAVILVSAFAADAVAAPTPPIPLTIDKVTIDEEGIVQSVVQSMLEGAGGDLHVFKGTDGSQLFRVVIPYGNTRGYSAESSLLSGPFHAHLTNWQILSAGSHRYHRMVDHPLQEMGAHVDMQDDIVTVLAHIESHPKLDAIILEQSLLGQQSEGLLKALTKLCPRAGLVVLCDDPDAIETLRHTRNVVLLSGELTSSQLLNALLESRALAGSSSES